MATDIVLRSIKASALTHAEMDQNWESLAQTIDSVLANYTVLVTDQNKILESNIASGNITLPTVANAAGIDTDSFKITVKNIHATSVNLLGNGSETIDGSGGITLLTDECVTLSLSANSAEWTVIAVHGPNLTGITATSTEINYTDITTLGTAQANKVMTTDASNNFTSSATVQAAQITGTTVNASTTLQIGGVNVTASAAELNTMNGILASTAELNYSNNVTSDIQGQLNDRMQKASNLGDVTNAATSRTNLGVDAAGTDNSTNVSLAGTPNYITIAGQVITRALISLTSHVTGLLPVANGGTASSTSSGARTNLGVDAAGTDNSTNVSLAGTPNYLTIAGQVITRALISLTSHVTGILPIANGGTASSTASGARTGLGLVELASSITAASTYHYIITRTGKIGADEVIMGNRANNVGTTFSASYSKRAEFIVPVNGTYRILTNVKATAGTASVRIYKNSAALGTESSTTSTTVFTELSEDLVFSAGDLLQLYTKQTVGGTYGDGTAWKIQVGSSMYGALQLILIQQSTETYLLEVV